MNILNPHQVGYLAALFDGEGTIALNRKRQRHSYVYSLNVCITNTNIRVLNWCLQTTQLGIISPYSPVVGCKQAYVWKLRTDEIAFVLGLVQSFLIIKWEQAELVLEYLKNHRGDGSTVSEQLRSDRNIIFEELRDLNKRGTL